MLGSRFSLVVKWVTAIIYLNFSQSTFAQDSSARPNILLAIADDWGWPQAGGHDDPVLETPTFDRLAREGVLFTHAFASSPSCTPSRAALLSGQWHWRLQGAANLWGTFPDDVPAYPELLQESGYEIGYAGKGYGPGFPQTRDRGIAGKRFKSFQHFLKQRDLEKPFCFWLGSADPHRGYDEGSGVKSGINPTEIALPAAFPDVEAVRSDVADYYWEVQRFDAHIGHAVTALQRQGELENTIVVMTGDNGMPFPRGKSNLYDLGTQVPLVICWPAGGLQSGKVVTDFANLTDLAPTFLQFAGLKPTTDMTGNSLAGLLLPTCKECDNHDRTFVLVGKERHVPSQEKPDWGGYPSRAIRTEKFLFIRNYRPERWPNGTPNYENAVVPGNWYADTDNGPTKSHMITNRDKDAAHRRLYDLAFAKRPSEELYDLKLDSEQLNNVADDPKYSKAKSRLSSLLTSQLAATADPRENGGGEKFDQYPYLGSGPKHPDLAARRKQRQ